MACSAQQTSRFDEDGIPSQTTKRPHTYDLRQSVTLQAMRAVVQKHGLLSFMAAIAAGVALASKMPFSQQNDLLQLVLLQKPYLFYGIKCAYVAMLFTTPYRSEEHTPELQSHSFI